jgi:cysteine desulfurase/selenocysteine lyase
VAIETSSGAKLFGEHVERFNSGVRTGDFGPMVGHFAPDAILEFIGVPAGPFVGRDSIAAAYRDQPPDDEIDILSVDEPDDATVVARYAWRRDGATGTMRLGHEAGEITGLTVSFDPPAPRAAAGIDAYAVRRDFPILSTEVNGHPLVYLDSASSSQKPQVVIDAVDQFYREYNANVHRGIYTIGERSTAAYERARAQVARFINAPDAHEVVFTRNATEAINLVAYSWGRKNIERGDAIVLTEMEHHANLVPWQLLVQEKDGDLEFIPITDDGLLRLDVFEVLLRLKPKLVAFTHVSNTLGTINPVAEMVEMAHAAGALVLLDGAQAVPHVPVDVQAIGADFYAFSGHKMLGPTGSGALWARRELLEAMPPFLAGGEMIREVHLRRSEWNDIPWKFEAGTPDIAAAIGLGVAAEYLMDLGMDSVRQHERELVAYALDVLPRELPTLSLYGPMDPDLRGGVVPFNVPGVHPHDVAQVLDRFGVCVRAGHHCTMPLHERLDLPATARASFNVYSTREDIDALIVGLREVVRLFGVGD